MTARNLLACHPKIVLGVVFLTGISAWYLPLGAVIPLGFIFAGTAICFGGYKKKFRQVFWAYSGFIALWAAGRVGFALFNGAGLQEGGLLGLDLALRLLLIAGAGASLLFLLTPCRIAKEAGLIVKWAAPESFWKLSLAILIMLSYFEAALFAWKGVGQTLKLRAGSLPLHRKMTLSGAAVLRMLSRQAWERAFAVAGRKLDGPDAWGG